jgi:hypothetical protein
MEATKHTAAVPGGGTLRMAGDLLWFAAASMGAGLMTALAAAALVILLAQPAYAGDGAPAPRQMLLTDQLRAPLPDDGFLRLVYHDRRELGELLRHVQGALPDLCLGDELADEAHLAGLLGAEDGAGQDDFDSHFGLAELRRFACII